MQLWLVIAAVWPVAAPAPGATLAPGLRAIHEQEPRDRLNFRLVEQPAAEPLSRRHSGMIVETSVAPNAAVGLGLFNVGSRRLGPPEPRLDGRKSSSKKAGVSFRLKF